MSQSDINSAISKVTRFEVIDGSGRAYVSYDAPVTLSIQDQGATLKVFSEGKNLMHSSPSTEDMHEVAKVLSEWLKNLSSRGDAADFARVKAMVQAFGDAGSDPLKGIKAAISTLAAEV
jgi:TATA-box binding protein (TBP) (component of TFIID and TFIIIB)